MPVSNRDVRLVQVAYPQIYFACHTRHVRRASTATQLSAADSTLLAHLDEQDAVREDGRAVELLLSARGAAAMQASSVLDSARVKKMLRQLTVAERQRALDGLALLGRAARKAQGAGK